jgi:hypothetical protein
LKKVLQAIALVVIAFALITVRVLWSSRAEFRAAEESTGELRILHYGRAARLYAPGNPFSRRALDALARDGSLQAWQEARSAILATRSCYTPHPELLAEANEAIARMMAEKDPKHSREWHAARLEKDDAPSVGWTIIALLGLGAWIAAAVLFILRAIDENDRLRPKIAVGMALLLLFGLTLFFVGLAHA